MAHPTDAPFLFFVEQLSTVLRPVYFTSTHA